MQQKKKFVNVNGQVPAPVWSHVKAIIADKLAFANKEADWQIWSLKGRRDRGDDHPMTRRWDKNNHRGEKNIILWL